MAGKRSGGGSKAPGKTFTKNIERGPNKGDNITFKVGPSGKPYPVRVNKDVGKPSTLRNNSGVAIGKSKGEKK